MVTERTVHVSLVATREVDGSALAGLHGTLNSFAELVPGSPVQFTTEVILPDSLAGETRYDGTFITNVMGIPVPVTRLASEVERTDVVIIPSLFVSAQTWPDNPYPDLIAWLQTMYRRGAELCSACTGALLLAETGLLEGYEATQHWAFEQLFRERFPGVRLVLDQALIRTGEDHRLLMTGASAAWHDLIIHLLTRYAGAEAAQTIASFFLLCLHNEGQAPYIIFHQHREHGDTAILSAQQRLADHCTETHILRSVIEDSGLTPRTFQRRFRKATSYTPITYVQNLRVEEAKKVLSTSSVVVDEICWLVGYEDPAFFRRIFKRITGMTPRAYRMKFSAGSTSA